MISLNSDQTASFSNLLGLCKGSWGLLEMQSRDPISVSIADLLRLQPPAVHTTIHLSDFPQTQLKTKCYEAFQVPTLRTWNNAVCSLPSIPFPPLWP